MANVTGGGESACARYSARALAVIQGSDQQPDYTTMTSYPPLKIRNPYKATNNPCDSSQDPPLNATHNDSHDLLYRT